MKIIYKVILIGMLVIALVGCDNKVKFDRVKAFSEYGNMAIYAPISKNIKTQISKSYIGNLWVNTTVFETDEQGRIIKLMLEYNEQLSTTIEKISFNIDYNNFKFDMEQPMFFIHIKKGNLILDDKGRISKATSKDGEYLFFSDYQDNKLINYSMIGPFFTLKQKFYWENNFLIKHTSSVSKSLDEPSIKMDTTYNYDLDGKLTHSKTRSNLFNENIDEIFSFEEWNEFGDWTKAKISIQNSFDDVRVERKLEYW